MNDIAHKMQLILPDRFETERLLLRKLRYEDAEQIFYVYASKTESTNFVSWKIHANIEQTRSFISKAVGYWRAQSKFTYVVLVKETGRLIGEFVVHNRQAVPQISYAFGSIHWKKGYATESCREIINYLQALNTLPRIETYVDAENLASMKVLKRCGFDQEERTDLRAVFVNQGSYPRPCMLFFKLLKELPVGKLVG